MIGAALPADDTVRTTLFALRELAGEAALVTLVDEATLDASRAVLASIVARTIVFLEALQALGEEDPVLEWDALESSTHTTHDTQDGVRGLDAADAWSTAPPRAQVPSVSDLAFAGALELRRIARELEAARTGDERLVASETARRKVRRAIRATLEAARIGGIDVIGGEHQGHHHVADLASGLAVRRMYARFRRALRRAEDPSPEAVLMAVRYAGGALATLVTAPDYADVRASDRAVLRRLRERALEWARGPRDNARGLQLIEDVWTCSDLMREINRRQELQLHDRELAREHRAGPAGDGASATGAWIAALAPLLGRDDRLDALLGDGTSPPALADARERPRHVRAIQACLEGMAR